MHRLLFITTFGLLLQFFCANTALAKKPACGLTYMPFVEGYEWTYSPIESLTENITTITIKVVSVKTKKGTTTILLEETYGDTTINTTATCTRRRGLRVSPESFLFSAEPATIHYLTIENLVQKKDYEYPPASKWKPSKQMLGTFDFDVLRRSGMNSKAVHHPAKINLTYLSEIKKSPPITLETIKFKRALMVEVVVQGEALVADQTAIMQNDTKAIFWMVPRLGIVQAQDAKGQAWQLTNSNLRTWTKKHR